MILRVLYDYYQTLVADPESGISQIGYSKEKVSFALLINKKGDLKDIIELREGKKPILMDVPQHAKRTSGVLPYFICDNPKYILGTGKTYYEQCAKLHNDILKDVNDESAAAVLRYFEKWGSKQAKSNALIKAHKDSLEKGGNIVFTVAGIKGYVHEKSKIKKAWKKYLSFAPQKGIRGQCLITGEEAELLEVHDSVKGVWNAQSSGAAIISFNKESFESYGKKQSINAPVGKEAAFAYITTLNYMLNPASMQNIQIGDATTVFWAEKYGTEQEELFYALFNPLDVEERKGLAEEAGKNAKNGRKGEKRKTRLNDPRTISRMRDFLGRVASGKGLKDIRWYDPDVKFYVLGLSPNAARISVRFFYTDTFGRIVERIKQHYADMLVERQYKNESDAIAVWQLLRETAVQGNFKNIQPAFSGGLMRAILMGGIYPVAVYQAIIARIGIDKSVNRNRMAFLKAYLQRKNRIDKKEGGVTMSLNKEERNVGYCLGRLFALLEKAQLDASPGINATIKDRYFGTASSSPKAVFPFLLRLGQHHIKYGRFTDKQIGEVMVMVGSEFPAHLNLDDQGRFMLGYYHQRNALYKKKEEVKSDK
ncbi:MAG: type I-C CRISPR-associated protein Cas8c/Csd1 [Candidatus Margulisiibacteriota bacterium]|nr:type I-C CRISPR-associated protein Cas8c/Csd1 [Candidatus Margulisiibacteriota bacterium]